MSGKHLLVCTSESQSGGVSGQTVNPRAPPLAHTRIEGEGVDKVNLFVYKVLKTVAVLLTVIFYSTKQKSKCPRSLQKVSKVNI